MIDLEKGIIDVSAYLQSLTKAEVLPKVRVAVEKKDRASLVRVFKKANIPERYWSAVTSVLLSVSPEQKYPPMI